jgi:hypothetical protein
MKTLLLFFLVAWALFAFGGSSPNGGCRPRSGVLIFYRYDRFHHSHR